MSGLFRCWNLISTRRSVVASSVSGSLCPFRRWGGALICWTATIAGRLLLLNRRYDLLDYHWSVCFLLTLCSCAIRVPIGRSILFCCTISCVRNARKPIFPPKNAHMLATHSGRATFVSIITFVLWHLMWAPGGFLLSSTNTTRFPIVVL